jgi:7-cyano-7-deazaguanine synthase
MSIKVAINGLGRIGRATLKLVLVEPSIELIAVNDLVDVENLAYLLRFDSVYGRYSKLVEVDCDDLVIAGRKLRTLSNRDPLGLPWKELDVELVFECTGALTRRKDLEKHIRAGARFVLLSAPSKGDEVEIQTVLHSKWTLLEAAEKIALERYLVAVSGRQLEPLTVLDLPMADVYGNHWSITGHNVPEAGTPDEAVFLPGRNALLTIKAALWCQMHGINELAVATLRSNPFKDASASYFAKLGDVLSGSRFRPFHLVRPFGDFDKQQVMKLGRPYPLDLTFSCIAPRDGVHCGQCNKCAERQAAFDLISSNDPTNYACAALGVV